MSATTVQESPDSTRGEGDAFAYDQVVILRVNDGDFAVPIKRVQEIVRVPALTRVPQAQVDVQGVINLRGQVLPVVDLGGRLGFGATEKTREARVVVVQRANDSVGLLVDGVSEVLRLSPQNVEPTSQETVSNGVSALYGVAKLDERLVLLLDLDATLAE